MPKFLDSPTGHQPRTQLATGILKNLSEFPHCILLTRVGQFYEVGLPRYFCDPPNGLRSHILSKRLKWRAS